MNSHLRATIGRRIAAAGALLLVTLFTAGGARAQNAGGAAAAPFELRGSTLDGKPFSLAAQRGKVVMVFFWSTDCAVCRSKMPELRANAEGWRGKPFEMVLVSLDRRRSDLVDYDQLRATTQANAVPFPNLWSGEAGYSDSLAQRPRQLPLTLVLDTKGRVAARIEGRIPAEAWDTVAELLP